MKLGHRGLGLGVRVGGLFKKIAPSLSPIPYPPSPSFLFLLFTFCFPYPLTAALGVFHPRPDPLELAQASFKAGRYSRVISLLSPSSLQSLRAKKLAAADYLLAESYARLGREDKALAIYQVAVNLHPKDIRLLMGLAELFRKAGLDSQARPLYLMILRRRPGDAEAHLGLARIDKSLGFLERSLRHYVFAMESQAPRAPLWLEESEVLLSLRDFAAARDAARRALAISPADPDALFLLARIARAEDDVPAALGLLDAAAKKSPLRPRLLDARALWLLEAGRPAAAARQARAILSSRPRDALAHWVLAESALRAGRRSEARRNFAAAARLSGDSSFLSRAAKAALKNI